jgi:hypothetical protein
MWTLLKFFPLNKLHESFITFPFVVWDLIFFASLILVVFYSAVQAVMLLASWTIQFCIFLFFLRVKYKSKFTVSSGTPRYILLHIYCQVKRKGTKLFILFSIKQVF